MGNNPSGGTPGMGNNPSGGTPGMGNNPSGGTPGMGGESEWRHPWNAKLLVVPLASCLLVIPFALTTFSAQLFVYSLQKASDLSATIKRIFTCFIPYSGHLARRNATYSPFSQSACPSLRRLASTRNRTKRRMPGSKSTTNISNSATGPVMNGQLRCCGKRWRFLSKCCSITWTPKCRRWERTRSGGGVDASRVEDFAVLTLPFLDITVDAAGLKQSPPKTKPIVLELYHRSSSCMNNIIVSYRNKAGDRVHGSVFWVKTPDARASHQHAYFGVRAPGSSSGARTTSQESEYMSIISITVKSRN